MTNDVTDPDFEDLLRANGLAPEYIKLIKENLELTIIVTAAMEKHCEKFSNMMDEWFETEAKEEAKRRRLQKKKK